MKNESNEIGLKYKEDAGKHPRLSQCFACKAWALDKNLLPIEVPDQAGWVEKKACKKCLSKVLKGSGVKSEV